MRDLPIWKSPKRLSTVVIFCGERRSLRDCRFPFASSFRMGCATSCRRTAGSFRIPWSKDVSWMRQADWPVAASVHWAARHDIRRAGAREFGQRREHYIHHTAVPALVPSLGVDRRPVHDCVRVCRTWCQPYLEWIRSVAVNIGAAHDRGPRANDPVDHNRVHFCAFDCIGDGHVWRGSRFGAAGRSRDCVFHSLACERNCPFAPWCIKSDRAMALGDRLLLRIAAWLRLRRCIVRDWISRRRAATCALGV